MPKLNWEKRLQTGITRKHKRAKRAIATGTYCSFCQCHHIVPGTKIVYYKSRWGHPDCFPILLQKLAEKRRRRKWFNGPSPSYVREYAIQHLQNMTPGEKFFWKSWNETIGHAKLEPQIPISGCIIDFYNHVLHLAVEIDGGYHLTPEQTIKDNNRDAFLRGRGITVLRFGDSLNSDEVTDNIKKIMTVIGKLRHEHKVKCRKYRQKKQKPKSIKAKTSYKQRLRGRIIGKASEPP